MASDIPKEHREKIEIVFAFKKDSIDTSYMAGEHLKPSEFFNPSFYNLLMRAFTPTRNNKNSSHQNGLVASVADESN